jgi:Holliday junction resolvase RusA-like endonuclease
MNSIAFSIPGPAVPERKRQVRMGDFTRRVDTPQAKQKKGQIQMCAAAAMLNEDGFPNPPLMCPLEVTIRVYRPKPQSWPKKRWAWTTIPDSSNFAKLIEDACTGIVWGDDAQIVRLIVEKHHRPAAGIEVEAREVTEEEHLMRVRQPADLLVLALQDIR